MLAFLLELPVIKQIATGIVAAVILIAAYSFWATHERHVGAQIVMDKMKAEALKRQQEIDNQSNAIDQTTAQQNNQIQEILRRDWSADQ
jgi:hypothetical protein